MFGSLRKFRVMLEQRPLLLSVLVLVSFGIYRVLAAFISVPAWLLPVYMILVASLFNGARAFTVRFDFQTRNAIIWAILLYIILLPLIGVVWWGLHHYYFHKPGDWVDLESLPQLLLWQLLGAALAEELLFRGVIMRLLDNRFGRKWNLFGVSWGWGLIVSSVVFGLAHVIVFGDAFGLLRVLPALLFGYFYNKENGLCSCSLLHWLFNLSVTLWR